MSWAHRRVARREWASREAAPEQSGAMVRVGYCPRSHKLGDQGRGGATCGTNKREPNSWWEGSAKAQETSPSSPPTLLRRVAGRLAGEETLRAVGADPARVLHSQRHPLERRFSAPSTSFDVGNPADADRQFVRGLVPIRNIGPALGLSRGVICSARRRPVRLGGSTLACFVEFRSVSPNSKSSGLGIHRPIG